ncbi:hypothetical protein OG592_43905 (plasmid) [Streptomyces avidinii]|uniref:hypothetical protein n=1 Tax=Streptomyces avidinii TaxID=1895 RepID=UPI002F90A3A4|nr:hypothetical protein OG592_43905 [Streptomyces avidinii]
MTQPTFTARELELLDEALDRYMADAYGHDNEEGVFTPQDWTALQSLSEKISGVRVQLGGQPEQTPEIPTCPGWGEECGTETERESDLCPDCHMARMDAQSPRIPL